MLRFFLVVAVALVLVGCSTIQIDESDVFLPKPSVTPASFDVPGVTLTEHRIAVDDTVQVDAWHLTQPNAEATVLFFGGNGFYLVQSLGYIEALTDFPVNVVMWDYRGYGNSGGTPTVPAFKADALDVYTYATDSLGADPARLLVHGHSLGTFLATHVASERSTAGVVLENPATDVDGWVNSVVPWYIRLFVSVEVDPSLRGESNVERVQTLDAPLLVVGGAEDNVTTPDMARTLHERAETASKELVIVDDGGHNELYTADAYRSAYQRLLDAVL
jgi:fermentation-respiration switch protein FrsA (DUF1100 family)